MIHTADGVAVIPCVKPRRQAPDVWPREHVEFDLVPVVWVLVDEPGDGWLPKDPARPVQTVVV